MKRCSHPRCDYPVAGVGEAYGLCVQHGHEERNRRLRERDASVPRPAPPRPAAPLTATPVVRPPSAIVGARPIPTTIQPSAATVAAKEPSMAQHLVLKPDAASLPPSACRILGCEGHIGNGKGARGLCSRHHGAAHKAGRLEELALPPTTRKPKAPTPAKPTPAAKPGPVEPEPRLSREEKRIATEQARQEEEAQRQIPPPGASLVGRVDLAWLRAEHMESELLKQRVTELQLERDTAFAKVVELEQRVTQLRAERAKAQPRADAAKRCANELGVETPERPPTPTGRPFRVKQAGQRDLGVLVGYIDDISGAFRVTSGPLAGAVYGCLYSAEPVERPELGEPETGATVWVRTVVDEVTPTSILTSDGGRIPRAEWGPGRFVRREAGPTTRIAWQPAPTVADDDLPF